MRLKKLGRDSFIVERLVYLIYFSIYIYNINCYVSIVQVLQDEDNLDKYGVEDGQTLHMVIRPVNRPPRSMSEGTSTDHANPQGQASSILDGLLGGAGIGSGTRMFNIGGSDGGNNAASAAASRLLMMSALGNSLRPNASPTLFPVIFLY